MPAAGGRSTLGILLPDTPMPLRRWIRTEVPLAALALLLASLPTCAFAAPPQSDYDADGAADVFWRNSSTGDDALWRSGERNLSRPVTAVLNPAWHVVAEGDFDGDGRSDLLWRQQASGANAIWPAADYAASQTLAAVTDLRWRVAGSGDFDGDGRSDVFWRDTVTGANAIWRSAQRSTSLAVTGVTNMEWNVAAIGDFNGDGKSDLFWRNAVTGADIIWNSADAASRQSVAGVTDPAWMIVGAGDFDGDGRADVFWRNTQTGADVVWRSGSKTTTLAVTGVTSQDWQVAAIGDYNGDGRADVFWRNARTGADVIWYSADAGRQHAMSAVTDQAWAPVPAAGQRPGASAPAFLVSAASPFTAGCDGAAATGILYPNAEVEPTLAVSPVDARSLIGAWQQDRWSDGASRGIVAAASSDGGMTWTRRVLPFSRCGGGNAGNGGDYARSTDPWLTIAPDGGAYLMALSTTGGTFQSGSINAMLVSRSTDAGHSWSAPVTLIRDGASAFNDKNAITADPGNAALAYAVWDRLTPNGNGPTYFTRTTNGGASWEPARAIYNPGGTNQTIGNLIVVLPDGVLVDLFTEIDVASDGSNSAVLAVIRSSNKGLSWSAPIRIADNLAIGTRDPQTNAPVRDGADVAQMAVAPDGRVYVVWQDARFSGGVVDGIALSTSADGGLHWSAPVRVNRIGNVAAFTPSVHVRRDGTIGIRYFDLRSDTADATSLLAAHWLATSANGGATWREAPVSPAFDLDTAPNAEGVFVGDYMALASRGALFLPFFVRTNSGDTGNRTDVFLAPAVFAASDAVAFETVPAAAPTAVLAAGFAQRVQAQLARVRAEVRPRSTPPRQASPP